MMETGVREYRSGTLSEETLSDQLPVFRFELEGLLNGFLHFPILHPKKYGL